MPVEGLEAVTVRHYTSRAGDPHRHPHLQVNARVHAAGTWRGLHTAGVRDSLNAINGIGHAAMMTDPQFRATLARHGFTLDPATGELRELLDAVAAHVRGRPGQHMLGHKSATETWDTYGHLMGDEDDLSKAVIHAALGAPLQAHVRESLPQ